MPLGVVRSYKMTALDGLPDIIDMKKSYYGSEKLNAVKKKKS